MMGIKRRIEERETVLDCHQNCQIQIQMMQTSKFFQPQNKSSNSHLFSLDSLDTPLQSPLRHDNSSATPRSFQHLLALINHKKQTLLRQLQKVQAQKVSAEQENNKWKSRLSNFQKRCIDTIGTHPCPDTSSNPPSLSSLMSDAALTQASLYLSSLESPQ